MGGGRAREGGNVGRVEGERREGKGKKPQIYPLASCLRLASYTLHPTLHWREDCSSVAFLARDQREKFTVPSVLQGCHFLASIALSAAQEQRLRIYGSS